MIEIIIVAIAVTLAILPLMGMKLYGGDPTHYDEKILRALGEDVVKE
jgi:hypothetical protein